MSIGPEHRRVLRTETLISIAINALLPAAVLWLVGKRPPQSLIGPDAIVGALIPAAGLATLLMTLVLTSIIRARVRIGQLPALDWPPAERGVLRHVPRNLVLRAITLALAALVILVPAGLAAVAMLGILPMNRVDFLIFNLAYGSIVGLVMARPVVLLALADPAAGDRPVGGQPARRAT